MIRSTAKALAVAAVAAATFGTATASAADTGDGLAAGVAAYKAAYPSLSDAQARADALGADARRAVYDAAAADASTFGGAWFDPITGAVSVAATTSAATERIALFGRRYAVAVKPVRVKRSAAALEAEAAALRAGNGELGKAANGNVGVDVKANEVVVAVPADRRAGLASKAAASNAKLVTAPAAAPEPDAGCTSRTACDWTIRAGAVMWINSASSLWCSVGFTARNASNTRFVYTAGHCNTGAGVTWGLATQSIGPLTSAMDSGAVDAAVIQVTNSWFTGDSGGEIYYEDGGARTAPVKGVASSVGYMVQGETVCLSANWSFPTQTNPCGVLGTNSDAGVRGMARVDGVDGCNGDSGGGWYWLSSSGNRYAYGIHSRSDAGCHGDQGGTRSWYTAIATAKSGFQPTLNVETR